MKIIRRVPLGGPLIQQTFGTWGWEMDGAKSAELPIVTDDTVVISMGVGHGLDWPEGIAKLRELLATEPLRPDYGGYDLDPLNMNDDLIWPQYPGMVSFHGNFDNYSFSFRFDTTDSALANEFIALIDANKATAAYADAVAEHEKWERDKAERQRLADVARDAERTRRYA